MYLESSNIVVARSGTIFTMLFFAIFLTILAVVLAAKPPADNFTEPPRVNITDQGVIVGQWKLSTNKNRYYASFQGIPYAQPPVEENRLRDPLMLPKNTYSGTYDATYTRNVCLQYNPMESGVIGTEDCLHLNVYTPYPRDCANMPVLVFIHGGAFFYGSANGYNADHFMDQNLVLVTMNYRLGPLGFLSTGDAVISGNFGLKDQSVALRWVHDYIKPFGGNPSSVTLMGHSAGGACVHYHMLSRWSKGLFDKAIIFSGSAFSPWAYQYRPTRNARRLAALIECYSENNNAEIYECLRERRASDIVWNQLRLMDPLRSWQSWNNSMPLFSKFAPTTEGPTVKSPFLAEYPYVTVAAKNIHPVPLMISIVSDEGLYPGAGLIRDQYALPDLHQRWPYACSHLFMFNDSLAPIRGPEVAGKIWQKYFNGKPIDYNSFPNLVEALGDRLFKAPIGWTAQMHALHTGQLTFLYEYKYRGSRSFTNVITNTNINHGVSHSDDVLNIFNFARLQFNDEMDHKMAATLIHIIYTFAQSGEPKLKNGKWKWVIPCTCPEVRYLEIESPTKMKMTQSNDFGKRSFWKTLGFNEVEQYKPINLLKLKDEL